MPPLVVGPAVAGAAAVAWVALSAVEVWRSSRLDQGRPVDAIVVLGATQYHGRPSPALKARLDQAHLLWQGRYSDLVVLTGGRSTEDGPSEAEVSAAYLGRLGVPADSMLLEPDGRNTWRSLAGVAALLAPHGRRRVLLVSDPFHDERTRRMAAELGLEAYVAPTRTSPLSGVERLAHFAKESIEVAVGRLTGFGPMVTAGERVLGRPRAALRRVPAAAGKVSAPRSGVV